MTAVASQFTQYVDIQKDEVSVLESIYLNDIEIVKPTYPYKIAIDMKPFLDNMKVYDDDLTIKIIIDMPTNYPNEEPFIQILPNSLLNSTQTMILEFQNKSVLQKLKGEPVVFEVIENMRKWIQLNIVNENIRLTYFGLKDELISDQDVEEVLQLEKKEERLTFTPVTVESFLEWNSKFILEYDMTHVDKSKSGVIKGKAFFQANQNLPIEDSESDYSDSD